MQKNRAGLRNYSLILGSALYVAAIFLGNAPFAAGESGFIWRTLFFAVPYLIIGGDVLFKAARGILNGRLFDENFLMGVATIGAFCIGESVEAVAVMLFYQVGEMFQRRAVGKSRESIAELMDIRADYANIENEGDLLKVDPEDVGVGEIIIVKPGERIPLDGVVTEGVSLTDTSALTGESVPREISAGSAVLSGYVNLSGLIKIEVTAEYGESTASRILELIENAASKKAKMESFITRFAAVYTPAVVFAAALLATLPPLFFAGNWALWLNRALKFLVISCPCALVISVPMSFFGGIGGASRRGILVKGGNCLEALAKVTTVVFDKTGTLTRGVFEVTEIEPAGISENELLELAAYGEHYSDHPIALSIKETHKNEIDVSRIDGFEEIPGHGVRLLFDGKQVLAGNGRLMRKFGVDFQEKEVGGTVLHVAAGGIYRGNITISDAVKDDAADAVTALKSIGVKKTVMLTGDRKDVGESIAKRLGLDEVYCELLPDDKVAIAERLLKNQKKGETLAFIGDGINDAPVLMRADVGIAMGGIGSGAAIEAADVVLMDDRPLKIPEAVRIARKTLRIVSQNVVFALTAKGLLLFLGAIGAASMWAAVFADVGVSVIAILNAMRALKE